MVKYCESLKLTGSEFQHKGLLLLFNTSNHLGLCFVFFSVSPPKWSPLKAILSFSLSYFPKHMALNIVADLKSDECMKEWQRMKQMPTS